MRGQQIETEQQLAHKSEELIRNPMKGHKQSVVSLITAAGCERVCVCVDVFFPLFWPAQSQSVQVKNYTIYLHTNTGWQTPHGIVWVILWEKTGKKVKMQSSSILMRDLTTTTLRMAGCKVILLMIFLNPFIWSFTSFIVLVLFDLWFMCDLTFRCKLWP